MNLSGNTHQQQRRRVIPATVALATLGVDHADPRCPSCLARFAVCDDPTFGVSVRCTVPQCRLGRLEWQWPEYALAELRNLTIKNAAEILRASDQNFHEALRCFDLIIASAE